MLSINLRSAFLLTQLACRRMLAQERPGGSVVNIASVHTAGALPASVAYDAATWGMIGMTKSLAVELADRNLRFNAVSPGLVATRIWEDVKNAAPSHAECEAHFGSNIPIGRPIDRCRRGGRARGLFALRPLAGVLGHAHGDRAVVG